jgi:hypothetical protein
VRPHLELTRITDRQLSHAVATPRQLSFGLALAYSVGPRGAR